MASPIKAPLRRGDRRNCLEVVAVQVTLEIEIRQHIALRHAQKTLQLRVRHNRVLVLEVLLLDVGGDSLGHIGPALLGAIAHTQKCTQVIGQSSGDLKDRGLPGLHLLTLHGLLGLATTLVSLLLQLGHTLLHALQLRNQGTHSLTHGICLCEHCLHIILHRHHCSLGRLNGGSRHTHRDNHCRCRHRRRSSLLLLGSGSLLNLSGKDGCRHGRSNLISLLRNRLLGNNLGGRSRVHYTRCRGRIHGGNTHISSKNTFNFRFMCLGPLHIFLLPGATIVFSSHLSA